MLLDSLDLTADAFADTTGWRHRPEGMCKGDSCVPAPGAIGADGRLDVGRSPSGSGWRSSPTAMPASGHSALTAVDSALTTATVPPIELPDIDGNPFDLTAMHGRKVLLVAWASMVRLFG